MLRRSAVSRIKPMAHAFSPARTASEKGFLYRSSNINRHARTASIHYAQRTAHEDKVALLLNMPDQFLLTFALTGVLLVAIVALGRQHPFSANTSRQQWLLGMMSEHELFERGDEMTQIIDSHAEEARGTLEGIERPAVFAAPANYSSPSGAYA